jgi:ABC-type transport system involved in multi-copper enzyme maturation permease subunit
VTEIHDQSYRRYGGARERPGRAWSVIASAGIRAMVRRRVFLGLLVMAWIPFVVRTVQIYFAIRMPQAGRLLAVSPQTFRHFLDQQGIFIFLITIWAGAGLIANDRRANALQIYLSKPLSRAEYVIGKLAVPVFFLLLITWVPAMLLLIMQVALSGSLAFIGAHIYLFPAVTLFALLQVLVASLAMLALSSLSTSSRFVGIMFTAVVLFTDALYGMVYAITGSNSVSWISFPASLAQLGDVIFRIRPLRYETPWPVSLAALVFLMVLSALVLERRVRGVEVVT